MEDYRNYESPGDFFLGLQKGLVSFIKNRIEEVTFVPLKQFQYCVRLGISLNIQLINFSLAKCIRLSVTISKFFEQRPEDFNEEFTTETVVLITTVKVIY